MFFSKQTIKAILNTFFSAKCAGCGAEGEMLCQKCFLKIEMPDVPEAGWIYAAANYRDIVVRNTIRDLKYRRGKALAKQMAELISERCLPKIKMAHKQTEEFLIIPIPLSRAKERKRGFNQAEEIAKHLPFEIVSDALVKIKATPSQVSVKDREKRLSNIEGSFAARNPEKIKGRNIIIIDDVLTTGATLKEARKTLKSAGAKKVLAIVAARG